MSERERERERKRDLERDVHISASREAENVSTTPSDKNAQNLTHPALFCEQFPPELEERGHRPSAAYLAFGKLPSRVEDDLDRRRSDASKA